MAYFSYINWLYQPGVTITPEREVPTLPAQHLTVQTDAIVYRVNGMGADSNFYVDIDFGANRSVQLLALTFPRSNDAFDVDATPAIATTDTIRHYLDADGGTPGAGVAYDSTAVQSGVLPGYGVHAIKLASPVTARYWRFLISAPSRAASDYIDMGRAWAGPIFEPTYNFSYGDELSWSSSIRSTKASDAPVVYLNREEPFRTKSFSFDAVAEAQTNDWDAFYRRAAMGVPMFVSWGSSIHKDSMIGYVAEPLNRISRFFNVDQTGRIVCIESL